MVDVDEHGVEAPVRGARVEPRAVVHREEVAVHEPAPPIGGQRWSERHQTLVVPGDHGFERVHHDELAHPLVGQRGPGGVAEPEAAHRDVQRGPGEAGQRQPGQLDLGDREQAGHQELVPELDLEHVLPRDGVAASAEAHLTDRRGAPAQLLEPRAHPTTFSARVHE